MSDAFNPDLREVRFIDLRRVHQFVVAVEAPTLREAAAELFVTQQGLSASLRQLEAELDVDLFSRTNRTLTITRAGEELYRRAPVLLAGGRSTVQAVHQSCEGAPPLFTVGRAPAVSAEEVYELIAPVRAELPHQPFRVTEVYPDKISEGLLSGQIDVAIRCAIDPTLELASAIAAFVTIRVAVAASHPLASRSVIALSELANYPIAVWAPEHSSCYTEYVANLCRAEGFEPRLVANPVQGTPPTTIVAASSAACAFVHEPAGPAYGGALVVIDIDRSPRVPLQAVWLPHTVSGLRDRLLSRRIDTQG